MSAETAPQDKPKKEKAPAIDVVASLVAASAAVAPYRLSASKGINPGGYAVDVIGANDAKRELACGMTARELVAFLNGIAAATTFIKGAK